MINVGIIGCGNISGIYFDNLINVFQNTNVYACADINPQAAKAASEKWNVPVLSVDDMLACPDIRIILNLTTPGAHFDLCKRALENGKNVYVEKPLSLKFEQGCELVELAQSKGLLLGGAPDTFLGGGLQTCRKLIDDGFIGEPIGATAFMMCHGHESWHPSPEFYYKSGGGPMFDMGPYYLTALVFLLGSVIEVAGLTNKTFEKRTITSQPKYGQVIDVEVPTYVAGLLRFENGGIGTIITSFDVWNSTLPRIEIYGTKGSLIVPDPNTFGGPVLLSTLDGGGFKEIPLTHIYAENSRGIGVSDMAACILDNRTDNRASGRLANHVLEIMSAIHTASDEKIIYKIKTKINKPNSMPSDLIKGQV
ncbi:MAG TPA: Gfo/Idh/MocA family oxidoreductase [Clostridia bacterium]|nr:Gfo/Idh/MocA family oxidoreductase [Clostridia bacterium]